DLTLVAFRSWLCGSRCSVVASVPVVCAMVVMVLVSVALHDRAIGHHVATCWRFVMLVLSVVVMLVARRRHGALPFLFCSLNHDLVGRSRGSDIPATTYPMATVDATLANSCCVLHAVLVRVRPTVAMSSGRNASDQSTSNTAA